MLGDLNGGFHVSAVGSQILLWKESAFPRHKVEGRRGGVRMFLLETVAEAVQAGSRLFDETVACAGPLC